MTDRVDVLLDNRHAEVLDAIRGVHARLDTLNGRTRHLEVKVGVLSWAYAVSVAMVGAAASRLPWR